MSPTDADEENSRFVSFVRGACASFFCVWFMSMVAAFGLAMEIGKRTGFCKPNECDSKYWGKVTK